LNSSSPFEQPADVEEGCAQCGRTSIQIGFGKLILGKLNSLDDSPVRFWIHIIAVNDNYLLHPAKHHLLRETSPISIEFLSHFRSTPSAQDGANVSQGSINVCPSDTRNADREGTDATSINGCPNLPVEASAQRFRVDNSPRRKNAGPPGDGRERGSEVPAKRIGAVSKTRAQWQISDANSSRLSECVRWPVEGMPTRRLATVRGGRTIKVLNEN
jgi:hypothetical protein